jgi:hypothetical protein
MDINYYKKFNIDLIKFSNNALINHFNNYGKNENRIYNETIFYKKYPDFDYNLYGAINKDLSHYSKFDLQKHFHLHGHNEKRIYSKKKFYECYPNFLLENNNLFKNDISEYELLVNYHNYGNFNNYFDFEINNYYDNSHLSKYSSEILSHTYMRSIKNINELLDYQTKNNKKIIINNKELFYKYYSDFDLDYYKNKYLNNKNISTIEIISYYHNIGKNLRHTKNNKLKIVIYTPIFDITCGGVVVMHNLVKLINELHNPNIYAKLFIINGIRYKNIFCNDFATIEDIDDNTLVIYPEIVSGNPLNAKNVLRWILLDLGIDMPLNHYENWGNKDLIYFWETKDTTNNYFKQLSCPWLNNIFYNKGLKFEERYKTCYLIKKGLLIHKNINYYHNKNTSLCLDNIKSLKEKSDIFNECKYFYCYDPNSMYVIYALLCGCIPVIYPLEGVSKTEYMKNRICNCNNELIDIGFAYGNSENEINNSIQKNKNSGLLINKIFDFYKNNVSIFCDEIYNNVFNNNELDNTVKNYYK